MNVALYTRVSSDSQDVDLSLSAQLKALREYVKKMGYQVVREFVEEAESGRSVNRPAFKAMIAPARTKEPPFEAILVWKMNRFARNRLDSITYKKLLRDRGIQVISINEPFDDSPSGHMLEGIIESIDEFYSENLGQDIRRGMRENAERGFFNGSRPPYGFKRVPVQDGTKTRYKLEPESKNSVSVRLIKRIFDLAYKGKGAKEIAKMLNDDGLLTSTGNRWGKTTVHKILTNEAYCGTLVWGGRSGHRAISSGIPPVRVENAWLSIIDKAIFKAVRHNMASRSPVEIHPRIVPSFYLLSSILYYSCGQALIGRSAKSHQYYYYVCNRSHKQGKQACIAKSLLKDKLETLIINQIKEKILNNQWLGELVELVNEELDSGYSELKEKLDIVDTELTEIGIRLKRNHDALETGKLSIDDLAPRIKELRAKEDDMKKTRIQIEAELILQGKPYIDPDTVKA